MSYFSACYPIDVEDHDVRHDTATVQSSILRQRPTQPLPPSTANSAYDSIENPMPGHLTSTSNPQRATIRRFSRGPDTEEDVIVVSVRRNRLTVSPGPIPPHIVTQPIRFQHNGTNIVCAPGKTVEFDDKTFMRITDMFYGAQRQVNLVGPLFYRQNVYRAKVPKRPNELIWIIEDEALQNNGLVSRTLDREKIVRNRELHLTNRQYPKDVNDPLHPRNHPSTFPNDSYQNARYGPLFCRLKRFSWFGRNVKRDNEEKWEQLSEFEADAEFRIPSYEKRKLWRGATELGGSSFDLKTTYNLETGEVCNVILQKYTFGDAFCGAGGASCGARMAGLHIQWSFDFDEYAIQTYRRNFPHVDSRQVSVEEFANFALVEDLKIDILHLSPPCQYFSGAHTVMSQTRDEANSAALLCVDTILERIKPRIVTLEQTSGLEERHSQWFEALLHMFIRHGYSCHWKLVNCADYGVSQSRKRLFIIGAGPGEKLPPFPAATHGQVYGRQPLETIGQIIGRIPRNAANHNTNRYFADPKPPFSPNVIAKTVTTNGGVGNYHPSGLRDFTVREYACLQTVPMNYMLANVGITAQRRQIGNMVPPRMADAINKSIIECLQEDDEESLRRIQEEGQAVHLVDDDDDVIMLM